MVRLGMGPAIIVLAWLRGKDRKKSEDGWFVRFSKLPMGYTGKAWSTYGMLKLKLSDDILTAKTLNFVIVTSDNNKWPC